MPKMQSKFNNKFHIVEVGSMRLYFSYETFVAFEDESGNLVVRKNQWGSTTGRHLNEIDGGNVKARVDFDEFIERYKKMRESLKKPDLSKLSTKELSEELAKRTGVFETVVPPYETEHLHITGPAIVLVNND